MVNVRSPNPFARSKQWFECLENISRVFSKVLSLFLSVLPCSNSFLSVSLRPFSFSSQFCCVVSFRYFVKAFLFARIAFFRAVVIYDMSFSLLASSGGSTHRQCLAWLLYSYNTPGRLLHQTGFLCAKVLSLVAFHILPGWVAGSFGCFRGLWFRCAEVCFARRLWRSIDICFAS